MFTPTIRVLLILGCLLLGAWDLRRGSVTGWLLLVAGVLLAFGYFRYATIWLAWKALKAGDVGRCKSLLEKVPSTTSLTAESRAYYEMAHGYIAAEEQSWASARGHFQAALSGPLRTANDRSLAACQLAAVSVRLGDIEGARNYLEMARKQSHKPAVAQLIQQVASQIAPSG
jgi:uncharacterized protein HemY